MPGIIDPAKRKLRSIVFVFYALSGFASLAYQVAWFRILVDAFGSTNLTFVLVIVNFIGGLGLGALSSRFMARNIGKTLRIRHPLRQYGFLELTVSVLMLATVGLIFSSLNWWGPFPYHLEDGIYFQNLDYRLGKVVIAMLCVFVPCFFMGMTYPLLCAAFQEDSRFPSALYAWNTLGACSGVLACEFFFLPSLGHNQTLLAIITANTLLGLFFILKRYPTHASFLSVLENQPATAGTLEDAHTKGERLPVSIVLACGILSGLLCGGLEADVFRRLYVGGCNHATVMSFISFWAILAIFLASTTINFLPRIRLTAIQVAFGLALVVFFISWNLFHPVVNALGRDYFASLVSPGINLVIHNPRNPFFSDPPYVFLTTGWMVFPVFYLISWLFPYACNQLQQRQQHLGLLCGLNTVSFCLGMIAFGWVAPSVNVFYSMRLFQVFIVILVLVTVVLPRRRSLPLPIPILATAVLVFSVVVMPDGFDRSALNPNSVSVDRPVRAMRSNATHTIYVVEHSDDQLMLYFDGHSMSGTDEGSQRYMRLMAHFPLLLHENPEQALLICFGVGNTASAIAHHNTIRGLDVVDLNHEVFKIASEFARFNHKVYKDPRVRLINDDGRNFLNITDKKYDLITSEPPPPHMEGVYRLYSKEYYQSVLDHLTPNGIMTQWVPLHQLSTRSTELIIGTFTQCFPHSVLFVGNNEDLILMGGPSAPRFANLEARFGKFPGVQQDMSELGIHSPLHLLARVIQPPQSLLKNYAHSELISDLKNDLVYLRRGLGKEPVVTYEPESVLRYFDQFALGSSAELRMILSNLGYVRTAIRDFPFSCLAHSPANPEIAFSDRNWKLVGDLTLATAKLLDSGGYDEAIVLLEQALAEVPDLYEVRIQLANFQSKSGHYAEAEQHWKYCLQMPFDRSVSYYGLAKTYYVQKEYQSAIDQLVPCIQMQKKFVPAYSLLASILIDVNRIDDALAVYDTGLKYLPNNRELTEGRDRILHMKEMPNAHDAPDIGNDPE